MSASRRARASFTVAVRIDASGAAFTDLGSGRSVCLRAFRGGRPRADQISHHTDQDYEHIDAGTDHRETERPIERVRAWVGDAIDRGERTEGEWKFDSALGIPEALAPVRARDGHAHLDRE